MIKATKKNKFIYFFTILAFSLITSSPYINAQQVADDKSKKQIKYRKARALSSKVAKKMAKVYEALELVNEEGEPCLLYTSPSPRDGLLSRMPSSA